MRFRKKFDYFLPVNSIFIFISSISFLVGFSKINIKYRKGLNLIASSTFGVYLIHDNLLCRPFLWNDLFKNATYINSNKIYIHAIVVIMAVYIICTLVDFCRKFLFEKTFFVFVEKIKDLYYKNLNNL